MLQSSNNHVKAYIQIDTAFIVLMFILFFTFVVYRVESFKNTYNYEIEFLNLKSQSDDICFMFSYTSGDKYDWENNFENVSMIGFLNDDNSGLNMSKVEFLNDDVYFDFIDKLGVKDHLYVRFSYINSTLIKEFGFASYNYPVVFSNSICFIDFEDEIVKMEVKLWK